MKNPEHYQKQLLSQRQRYRDHNELYAQVMRCLGTEYDLERPIPSVERAIIERVIILSGGDVDVEVDAFRALVKAAPRIADCKRYLCGAVKKIRQEKGAVYETVLQPGTREGDLVSALAESKALRGGGIEHAT